MALVTSALSLTLQLHQELHSGGGSFLCPLWATVTRLVSPMQPCPLCSHTLHARCLSAGGLAGRKRHLSSPPPLGGSLSHFSIEYLLEVLPPLQASTGYIPFPPLGSCDPPAGPSGVTSSSVLCWCNLVHPFFPSSQ